MAKQNNLKQKAVDGMIWTSIEKFSKMGIQFISGIVLARLLTPFDYGCIGMLMVFITLSDAFIDGGFGSALIQKKRPTQEDYSTIFFWNMGISVILYSIIYFSAPVISRFYRIPLLCDVLRVQALVIIIYALNVIQSNQLRKQLKFKTLAITRIFASVTALITSIILAYKGFGVWVLVIQEIIMAAIPMLVFWMYTKWHPSLVYSWKSFKELSSFGVYMFFTNFLNLLSPQIQNLFIGRIYSPTILGFYTKANRTERLASHSVSDIMSAVTYPLYAKVQDDMHAMQNMIKRLTTTIAYITFPLLVLLMVVAKPVFVLLYSDRWVESVPYFQLLCLAGMGVCLASVNTQPIAAIGKSKIMFGWTLFKRIIGLSILIVSMLLFGIFGLIVGVIFNCWLSYAVNIYLVSKYIGYKWTRQLSDIIPIMLATFVSGAASFLIGNSFNLGLYTDGLLKTAIFIAIYVGWSLVFKPESFIYTVSVIKPMVLKHIPRKHTKEE